jgi:hypothetical protein
MDIDRRTALLSLISSGTFGLVGRAADATPMTATAQSGSSNSSVFHYAMESGQRAHRAYAIAVAEFRGREAHQAAFRHFRRSADYRRRLAYRSSDCAKLGYAHLVTNYCLTQPGIRFDIMLRREPMPGLGRSARHAFIAEEYAQFLERFPRQAGGTLVTKPDLEPHRGALLRAGLGAEDYRTAAPAAGSDDLMQAASLVVGSIASAIAERPVRGPKREALEYLACACGSERVSVAALERGGNIRLHVA